MKNLQYANGDQMPILGLGTWKAGPGEVYEAVRTALRLGYRHIDCATVYGNEAEIGQALADAMAAGDVSRDELWITSKLWNDAHRQEDVRPALLRSLHDLQLDHLNLYLIHWPVVFKSGAGFPQSDAGYLSLAEVPLRETWSAMEACVHEGLVRHIGVSNFSARKCRHLIDAGHIKPEMNQVEMHPLLSQQGLRDFCVDNGILMTAYSPLGSGDRPASFKAEHEPQLMELTVIKAIAAERKRTPAQILLAWAVKRGTAVIPKSVNPQRLHQNLEAAEIELTEAEMAQINALDCHYRFVTGATWKGPNTPENLWDEK
ncbi:MAG: aldo/keto reductase [Pseudomonadales bacterium]|nr:aldo/keto reductase [Pseudomonadales bacterium]